MSGDTTYGMLERLTQMPDRADPQGDRIAGQFYYDVLFTGGTITGITPSSLPTPLAIADGGTAATTAQGARTNLLPSQAGNSGFALKTNGTDVFWSADIDTGITQLTGDVTAGPGNGSQIATLATVNSNVGTFGSPTTAAQFTVNGKGLITSASQSAIVAPTTNVTDNTSLNATVYPSWVSGTSGSQSQQVSSTKFTFNPSTGALSSTSLVTATVRANSSAGVQTETSGGSPVAVFGAGGSPNTTLNGGVNISAGRLLVANPTEQLRLQYDSANYGTATVSSTGVVTLAAAGTAPSFTFSNNVTPTTNDGSALGTGTLSWGDLFLASGGVINWNNGNATLTHSAGLITSNANIVVPDAAFSGTWDGSAQVPTKNAIYDQFNPIFTAWTSYTPTVSAQTGTFTSAAATGAYKQIGKTVFWRSTVTITTVGTAADALQITLPVNALVTGAVGQGRESAMTGFQNTCYTVSNNSNIIRIHRYDNNAVIGAGYVVAVGGSYESV